MITEAQVNHYQTLTGINPGSTLDPLTRISHETCEHSCLQISTSDSEVHFLLWSLVCNEIQGRPLASSPKLFSVYSVLPPDKSFLSLPKFDPSATSAPLPRQSEILSTFHAKPKCQLFSTALQYISALFLPHLCSQWAVLPSPSSLQLFYLHFTQNTQIIYKTAVIWVHFASYIRLCVCWFSPVLNTVSCNMFSYIFLKCKLWQNAYAQSLPPYLFCSEQFSCILCIHFAEQPFLPSASKTNVNLQS